VALDQLWVDANFKEPQLERIRIGQPVKLTADVYGRDVVFDGRIAGLGAGLKFVRKTGTAVILKHERKLTESLIEGLMNITGVTVYGCRECEKSVAIVSFTVKGKSVSEIGQRLDEEYGILVRVGLHCAPAAHRTMGTFPEGTVRLAPGFFTTMKDVKTTLKAIERLARS